MRMEVQDVIDRLMAGGFRYNDIKEVITDTLYGNQGSMRRRFAIKLVEFGEYLGLPGGPLLPIKQNTVPELRATNAIRVKTNYRVSQLINWIPVDMEENYRNFELFVAPYPCTVTGFRWDIQTKRVYSTNVNTMNGMVFSILREREGEDVAGLNAMDNDIVEQQDFAIGNQRQGIINGFILNSQFDTDNKGARNKGYSNIGRKLLHGDSIHLRLEVENWEWDTMYYCALIEFFVKTK